MSARADMDAIAAAPKTTKEKAEAKAATAERVGISAREQAMCRIEGWKAAMRKMVDAYGPAGAEMASVFGDWGRDRWGDLFDA